MKSYELVLGPQDGAMVAEVGGRIPNTIFVGLERLGDGFAAYGSELSERFPFAYLLLPDGRFWHEYKLFF